MLNTINIRVSKPNNIIGKYLSVDKHLGIKPYIRFYKIDGNDESYR